MRSTFNLAAGILTVSILLFTACSDDSSSASSSAPEYKEYANLKEALSDISSIKNVQTIKAAPFFNEAYEFQFRQPVSPTTRLVKETTNEIMDFVAQYVKFEKSNTQRNALTKSSPVRKKIFRYPR